MDLDAQRRHLFINYTGPASGRYRDPTTAQSVRQHVMRGIGQSRRKRRRNPQIALAMRDTENGIRLSHRESVSDRPMRRRKSSQCPDSNYGFVLTGPFWSQHPLAVLSFGCGMDAFAAYGLALATTGFDRQHGAGGFWFPLAVEVSEMLRRVLANTVIHEALSTYSRKTNEAIALARMTDNIACIELNLASSDSRKATGNHVLRAILGSICYNFLAAEFSQAKLHLEGVKMIIGRRGGIASLATNNQLRLMLFWIDIVVSLLHDQSPMFPAPTDLLPHLPITAHSSEIFAVSCALRQNFKWTESSQIAIDCLISLESLSTLIATECAARGSEVWKDEIFLGLQVNPVAHRLLMSLPNDSFEMPDQAAFETLRMGMMLWIIAVKQKSQSYPGTATPYAAILLHLLEKSEVKHSMISDPSLGRLRFWLLLLVISTVPFSNERETALRLVTEDMVQLGMGSWEEVMAAVRFLPWIIDLDSVASLYDSRPPAKFPTSFPPPSPPSSMPGA